MSCKHHQIGGLYNKKLAVTFFHSLFSDIIVGELGCQLMCDDNFSSLFLVLTVNFTTGIEVL